MGKEKLAVLQNDWGLLLQEEWDKPYYRKLMERVEEQYLEGAVYPPRSDVYRALELTPFERVKVVILGQDPYHGPEQAHGLSFSVLPGVKLPPSLRNIYKELQDDIGCPIPDHGFLEHWAKQGVLLLNAVLTVRESLPNSHRKLGWETFTDKIISLLNERETPIAFVLWGKQAQDKGRYIDESKHFVLNSVHPSPLSAYGGFWGSKPFSLCNAFLKENGIEEIDWRLPERIEHID
ncbi:uracil-DNA glycosylase [Cohnella luojiensis]|uniref:Uracil-DNA glycosylase n=1 Tax=Cohnella luojiensis TaxID=652876 RepID=A0A4Y8MBR8_9BACL|nr:uracil-DNA glycosylase [Cohnella luojiensis]TFE31773.1 uracil-DNA glycosylase [Cohnella luojiensis]